MTYRDTVLRLGDDTAARVLAVHAALQAGELTIGEAIAVIVTIVGRANHRATSLADLALAATLSVRTGQAVPTLGLAPPADQPARLARSASTLLDLLPDTPDPQARVARLGRSEPLTRAQEARGQALTEHKQVQGWVRSVSGTGCQLCRWWARDGRVWPADYSMPTHKGCSCSQTPVLRDSVKPVSR